MVLGAPRLPRRCRRSLRPLDVFLLGEKRVASSLVAGDADLARRAELRDVDAVASPSRVLRALRRASEGQRDSRVGEVRFE